MEYILFGWRAWDTKTSPVVHLQWLAARSILRLNKLTAMQTKDFAYVNAMSVVVYNKSKSELYIVLLTRTSYNNSKSNGLFSNMFYKRKYLCSSSYATVFYGYEDEGFRICQHIAWQSMLPCLTHAASIASIILWLSLLLATIYLYMDILCILIC